MVNHLVTWSGVVFDLEAGCDGFFLGEGCGVSVLSLDEDWCDL